MCSAWEGLEMVRWPVSTTWRPPVEKDNQLQLCQGNNISWVRLDEISATRKIAHGDEGLGPFTQKNSLLVNTFQ